MRDISNKVDNVDVLSAVEFNKSIMEELENAVTDSGITLDPSGGPDTDSEMLSQALTRASQGAQSYQDSGAADAYVLTAIGGFKQPSAYTDGMSVTFQVGNTNTGASTVNISSLGVKSIVDESGTALAAGALLQNNYVRIVFDLANDRFVVTSYGGPASSGGVFESQLLHVREEQSTGVNSSGTFSTGSYSTMILNTVKTNEVSGSSLSTNQVSLPAGDYIIQGFCTGNFGTSSTFDFKTKIRDVTNSVDLVIGTNGRIQYNNSITSNIFGKFTLSGTASIELQARGDSAGNAGIAANYGEAEVYNNIMIWKVG